MQSIYQQIPHRRDTANNAEERFLWRESATTCPAGGVNPGPPRAVHMKTSAQRPRRHTRPRTGAADEDQSVAQTDKLSFHLRDANGSIRANNIVSHFVSPADPDPRETSPEKGRLAAAIYKTREMLFAGFAQLVIFR